MLLVYFLQRMRNLMMLRSTLHKNMNISMSTNLFFLDFFDIFCLLSISVFVS